MSTSSSQSSGSSTPQTEDQNLSRTSTNLLLAALENNNTSYGLQFPTFSFKLDRMNYSIWRANVLDSLDAFEMKHFVLAPNPPPATVTTVATTTAPASTTSNPDYLVWKRRDKFILLWMRTTISAALLGYVIKAETSHATWIAVEKMFQAHSRARSMHIKQQLNNLPKGAMIMLEYFEKKRALADSLADCLQPMSDKDFIACVVHRLDSSYGSFRAALNMNRNPMSFDDLLCYLLQEEERLSEEARQSSTQPAANYSQQRNSRSQSRSPADRPPTWAPPHRQSDGAGSSSSQPQQQSEQRSKYHYQLCDKLGHVARDCFNRFNLQACPSRHSSDRFTRPSQQNTQPAAYNASPSSIINPAWYLRLRSDGSYHW